MVKSKYTTRTDDDKASVSNEESGSDSKGKKEQESEPMAENDTERHSEAGEQATVADEVSKMDINDLATTSAKIGASHKRRIVSSDDEYTGLSDNEDESATTLSDLDKNENENDSEDDAASVKEEAKEASKARKPPAKRAKKPGAKDTQLMARKQLEPIELLDEKEGKQVPFLALCRVFELIEATPKRLEITAYAREFLLQVMRIGEHQLKHAVMLCINKIAPDHEGIELGIGESVLIKSIASATGRQAARVKQDHHELGDLGVVAQRGKSSQRTMFKPKPLSISKVFTTFKEIAMTSGSSSIQKKARMITGLLASCSDIEAKYLIRSLEGRLRIGLAESTIQTALAQAALVYERGEDEEIAAEDFQKATDGLKQVMSEFPIYDNIIESIYKYGISDVKNHCMLTPTLPVKPMLAKIEKAADDILRR
ncbi:ATP-dependent DNA ligase Cdc17, partial [Coemansia sp. BCRC 34490]